MDGNRDLWPGSVDSDFESEKISSRGFIISFLTVLFCVLVMKRTDLYETVVICIIMDFRP